jgi:hypothetical protein
VDEATIATRPDNTAGIMPTSYIAIGMNAEVVRIYDIERRMVVRRKE